MNHQPLTNATDIAILMHREVHFGSNFPVMIQYYKDEGIGSQLEFAVEQIEALAALEQQMGENLAALSLSGPDAEKIGRARESYQRLRDLYEVKHPESIIPRLIADLILSEEVEPTAEINALISQKRAAIPALLDLIRSDDFRDPLFPGYGRAPELAAICLGRIGDKSAIAALFESIHETEFFEESAAIEALKWIGDPARDFLLTVLKSHPINIDNERAAVALIQFDADEKVANACFSLLQEIDIKKHLPFATYLVLGCSGLKDPKLQEAFIAMANSDKTPSMLKMDMKVILKEW